MEFPFELSRKVDEIYIYIFLDERFCLKKNKIVSVSIKDKSCNSPEGLELY